MRIIDICVAFVILFIFFMIFRLFLFPDPDLEVGKLPPQVLTKPVWRFTVTVGYTIFWWILTIIFTIWVFWHILKMIPIIGQIIIAVVPPFRQLEKAGIFGLYDDLFRSIIRFSIIGVFKAFFKFFKKSGQYIFQSITGISIQQRKQQIVQEVTNLTDVTTTSDGNTSTSEKGTTTMASNSNIITNNTADTTSDSTSGGKGTTTMVSNSNIITRSNTTGTTTEAFTTDTITDITTDTTTDTTTDRPEDINENAEQESKYTATERKVIEDKFQLCVNQNSNDRLSAFQCQVRSVADWNTKPIKVK